MSIKVDLHFIVNGPNNQNNFTTQLLKLIFKADLNNQVKLARGFPNAVHAVKHWQDTGEILDLAQD